MKIPVSIAESLILLRSGEKIPASKMKHGIVDEMLDNGILKKQIRGRSKSLMYIPEKQVLDVFLQNHYGISDLQNYIKVLTTEELNRADAIAASSDSKLKKVRNRAGIPEVEKVWSNPSLTRQLDRHRNQSGLREIILEERANEFAFEGIRFWDMYRYRRAVAAFSAPVIGWRYDEAYLNLFFTLKPIQSRRFIVRDYLWPVSVSEINKNSNIIQNPGW